MKPQQPESLSDTALKAAELLVEAYRLGKADGGFIEWSDVDIAHEWARRAVFEARQKSRKQRRRAATGDTPEQGRGVVPSKVLDLLDRRLTRMRELATFLVEDRDESQDEALEAACELAALVLGLDSDASAGALPPAWQRR